MTKIKIVGALVFLISISLLIFFNTLSHDDKHNDKILDALNEQKAFTQEISKNIFYIYKNKDISAKELDKFIDKYIENMNSKSELFSSISSPEIKKQNEKIVLLWNKFYLYVQQFRDKNKITTLYSNILLEKIVKNVYNTNLKLVVAFDKLIVMHQIYFQKIHENSRNIQYSLFLLLIILLIYLFTQVQTTITFIQKFLQTSKKIITNSSIKDLEYIEIDKSSQEISQASANFNFLVEKINNSIEFSAKSIENSYNSLEICEKNIEELMELLSVMEEDSNVDKELRPEEDALILSLEELSISAINLKNLQSDLKSLILKKNL